MAEFCLECWNELNGWNWTEDDCTVDHKYLDLCEGCGKMTHVIIDYRRPSALTVAVRRLRRRMAKGHKK